jgi:3-hydroxyisobutyrate dehydrogenase
LADHDGTPNANCVSSSRLVWPKQEKEFSMKVGVAGLGLMGAAIAQRLIEVGHHVTVWNRSPAKAKPLAEAGATIAATPAELASAAEAVITMLTDAAAIESVYEGPAGLLTADMCGKLFIEMSTVRPATEIALAAKVRAAGAAFVECPVGGSTAPARQGQLIGLLGAEPADAARARPLLDQLCRRVEHCGVVGAGATMKLAINLPLLISWQAFGEAFALCRDLSIEPQRLLSVFTDISATTNALKARAPMVAAMMADGDPGATTFTLDSACKDLRTMAAEGESRGIELPLTAKAMACFEEASRSGVASSDASALAVYWSRRGKQ